MFQAMNRNLSGGFILPLPVTQAFELFTPQGETRWVPGWQPRYLHPADGRTQAGMVFTTGDGDELTLWTLADYQPASFHSRYVRVTPGSRFVQVSINCEALSDNQTAVTVTYVLTALSPAGNAAIVDFEAAYPAMLAKWQEYILTMG